MARWWWTISAKAGEAEVGRAAASRSSRTKSVVSEREFKTLDFARLWRGRAKTTEVELEIIAYLLKEADTRRLLEVGTGEGRLTPGLRSLSDEYVGIDVVRDFLAQVPRRADGSHDLLVAANLHHLPFVEGSFSMAAVVRVLNFLSDPGSALKDVYRVMAPGGFLIVSVQVRPSMASLVDDIKAFLANMSGPGTLTFSKGDPVRVKMTEIEAWQSRVAHFLEWLPRNGWSIRRVRVSGLEDYFPLKLLPTRLFVRLSAIFPQLYLFPTVFVLAQCKGSISKALPRWEGIMACPKCLTGIPSPQSPTHTWSCPSCKHTLLWENGILDARYDVAP